MFSEHRPLLLSIAYRMLGTLSDAEDMVQDAFVKWQQTTTHVDSPRAFLVTIVSRLCINHLKSARIRREEYVGSWLPEPVLTTSPGDESLSMAFLLVLERLNPIERAVFLLREVFDYEYGEIARIVEHSEASCRQILHRAKEHVKQSRPRFETSPAHREDLLHRFRDAVAEGDVDGLVSLLCEDVVLYADSGGKTAAVLLPIRGASKVARFVLRAPSRLLPADLVQAIRTVNGQPAVVSMLDGRPHSVFIVDVFGDRIRSIFIVANPDKLPAIGQPVDFKFT
jgi:RNA polymerase sigma-70 factor (ECF subfamily)